jgi:hypothetical protein
MTPAATEAADRESVGVRIDRAPADLLGTHDAVAHPNGYRTRSGGALASADCRRRRAVSIA